MPMKNFLSTLVLGLAFTSLAQASSGEIRVTCVDTRFSDLTKIEIQETDLTGQFQIVETLYNSATKKTTNRYSSVFGMTEIEKSEFPLLTSWNGYERKLIRYGRDNYAISIYDECGGGVGKLTCKETF